MSLAFHGAVVDLGEAHATAGDFGLFIAFVTCPRQLTAHERLDEAQPFVPTELAEDPQWIDLGAFDQHGRQTFRELGTHGAAHRANSVWLQSRMPFVVTERSPADRECRTLAA